MKNLGDRIDVGVGVRSDDGSKLEPEEQPAKISAQTAADVKAGGDRAGALPVTVSAEMTAAEAATQLASPCRLCRNWRPDLWPNVRRQLEATPEGRESLNRARAHLLSLDSDSIAALANGDELHDVEHALGALGICAVLTEIESGYAKSYAPIVTDPDATCPTNDSAGRPLPTLFQPRGDTRRASESIRDSILSAASGRGFRR